MNRRQMYPIDIGVQINYALPETLVKTAIYRVSKSLSNRLPIRHLGQFGQ